MWSRRPDRERHYEDMLSGRNRQPKEPSQLLSQFQPRASIRQVRRMSSARDEDFDGFERKAQGRHIMASRIGRARAIA